MKMRDEQFKKELRWRDKAMAIEIKRKKKPNSKAPTKG